MKHLNRSEAPKPLHKLIDGGTHVERIKGLSDGVIAIALTLLVLELHPPVGRLGSNEAFVQYLHDEAPKIVTYLVSFFLIMVYWIAHHRMFGLIRSYDRKLLWRNAFLLFWISFLPFPSAIVGQQGGLQYPWVFYALAIAATGISSWRMWAYAVKAKLVDPDLDPHTALLISRRALVPPVVFLFSIAFSFVDMTFAQFTPLLIMPLLRGVSYLPQSRPAKI